MLPILLHWKNERGMMRTQPAWRVRKTMDACERTGMTLAQALSLRRHHVKAINKPVPAVRLGLGTDEQVNGAAQLFVLALASHLDAARIAYLSEGAQKRGRAFGDRRPTPDFLFDSPLRLVLVPEPLEPQPPLKRSRARTPGAPSQAATAAAGAAVGARSSVQALAEQPIHWIDAKHFYGASTIALDGKSAVGSLANTARKYRDALGPGAFVFAYGCGAELAAQLAQLSVIALDAQPLDMRAVYAQQRTWCADAAGNILPRAGWPRWLSAVPESLRACDRVTV
jgi:hypothetical protein